MPALPIIVLVEQGYSLPEWFVSFLGIFGFIVLPCLAVGSVKYLIEILKGKKDNNE